ncbi:MAG: hypothetical protein U5L00_04695 [Desulfovermiculus sp.]|nr:hypothetical protein [Desulfovermiculus sp.]
MSSLLGIDLGLKTGLALYDVQDGLLWYRSSNFGSRSRLKSGVFNVLKSISDLERIVLEGGGNLAWIWAKEAERRNIVFKQITAQTWRDDLLLPRQATSGIKAKESAMDLALHIIQASQAPRPKTRLNHDCAEAILIGYWGVLDAGWISGNSGLKKD